MVGNAANLARGGDAGQMKKKELSAKALGEHRHWVFHPIALAAAGVLDHS
jgi:hypothetical protein